MTLQTTTKSASPTIRASTTVGAPSPLSFSTVATDDKKKGDTTSSLDTHASSSGTTITFTSETSSLLPRGSPATPLRRVSMASTSSTAEAAPMSVTAAVAASKQNVAVVEEERTTKDVLMGRGKGVHQWPGNVYYRQVVSRYQEAYKELLLTQRAEKVKIAATIVRAIQEAGGRFIEQKQQKGSSNNNGGGWSVISYARSIEKVQQALRERPAPKAATLSMAAARQMMIGSRHASFRSVGTFGLLSVEPPKPPPTPPPEAMMLEAVTTPPGAIVQCIDQDVLIGRVKKWPGNDSFRQLVQRHQEAFSSLLVVSPVDQKKQQQAIVDKIIQAIHDVGGRFLEQQPTSAPTAGAGQRQHPIDYNGNKDRPWIVATYDRAFEKVTRALREQRSKSSTTSAAQLQENKDECECQVQNDTTWEPLPLPPKEQQQQPQQQHSRFIPVQPFAV